MISESIGIKFESNHSKIFFEIEIFAPMIQFFSPDTEYGLEK